MVLVFLAAMILFAGGGTPQSLWIALPICVFLATYTPTAMHFMIGQAMFTLMFVVLFNLIQSEGWRTGLVRLEDIVVGTITAVVVGAIFWPRGARGQLRASLMVAMTPPASPSAVVRFGSPSTWPRGAHHMSH